MPDGPESGWTMTLAWPRRRILKMTASIVGPALKKPSKCPGRLCHGRRKLSGARACPHSLIGMATLGVVEIGQGLSTRRSLGQNMDGMGNKAIFDDITENDEMIFLASQ